MRKLRRGLRGYRVEYRHAIAILLYYIALVHATELSKVYFVPNSLTDYSRLQGSRPSSSSKNLRVWIISRCFFWMFPLTGIL